MACAPSMLHCNSAACLAAQRKQSVSGRARTLSDTRRGPICKVPSSCRCSASSCSCSQCVIPGRQWQAQVSNVACCTLRQRQQTSSCTLTCSGEHSQVREQSAQRTRHCMRRQHAWSAFELATESTCRERACETGNLQQAAHLQRLQVAVSNPAAPTLPALAFGSYLVRVRAGQRRAVPHEGRSGGDGCGLVRKERLPLVCAAVGQAVDSACRQLGGDSAFHRM